MANWALSLQEEYAACRAPFSTTINHARGRNEWERTLIASPKFFSPSTLRRSIVPWFAKRLILLRVLAFWIVIRKQNSSAIPTLISYSHFIRDPFSERVTKCLHDKGLSALSSMTQLNHMHLCICCRRRPYNISFNFLLPHRKQEKEPQEPTAMLLSPSGDGETFDDDNAAEIDGISRRQAKDIGWGKFLLSAFSTCHIEEPAAVTSSQSGSGNRIPLHCMKI